MESNRAGIFHPFASVWSKPPLVDPGLEPSTPSEASREKDVNFLRKGRRNNWTVNGQALNAKTRGNIRFRPLDDDDSTDSDTEEGDVSKADTRHVNLQPRPAGTGSVASAHSSTPTILGGAHPHLVGGKDPHQATSPTRLSNDLEWYDLPDYSDHEVDIASDIKSARHGPGWTPQFLQNNAQLPKLQSDNPHTDRVLSGTGRSGPSQNNSRESPKRNESPRWQAFWRDVNEKIKHKEVSRTND